MLIQKIRENGGKIGIFFLAALSVIGGVFYLRSQSLEKKLQEAGKMKADELEAIKKEAVDAAATKVQDVISVDSKEKLDSIANNPKETTVQEPVVETKTIPAQKKTVTVPTTTTTTTKSDKKTKSS